MSDHEESGGALVPVVLSFTQTFERILGIFGSQFRTLVPALLLCGAPLAVMQFFLAENMRSHQAEWSGALEGGNLAGTTGLAGPLMMSLFIGLLQAGLAASLCMSTLASLDRGDRPTLSDILHRGISGLGRAVLLILQSQLTLFSLFMLWLLALTGLGAVSVWLGGVVFAVLGLGLLTLALMLALVPACGILEPLPFFGAADTSWRRLRRAPLQTAGILLVFLFMTLVLTMALQWPLTVSLFGDLLRSVTQQGGAGVPAVPVVELEPWQRAWSLLVGLLMLPVTSLLWLATGVQSLNLKTREALWQESHGDVQS